MTVSKSSLGILAPITFFKVLSDSVLSAEFDSSLIMRVFTIDIFITTTLSIVYMSYDTRILRIRVDFNIACIVYCQNIFRLLTVVYIQYLFKLFRGFDNYGNPS